MKTNRSMQKAQALLGISKLRQHQIDPIKSILDGNDTLVIAPTSSGKSAIYQVPALVKKEENRWTLVIEPTLALIGDQVQKLQQKGIAAAAITSRNSTEHDKILRQLQSHNITLIYTTPEQLQTYHFIEATKYNSPWLIAVDEAHCVTEWGDTFRPKYLNIKDYMNKLKHRPVIAAFTATAPPDERKEIQKHLGMKKANLYTMPLYRENIILLKEDCAGLDLKQRLRRVRHYIKKYGQEGRVVVYCGSRGRVDKVANYLIKEFPGDIAKCHAYMDPDKREKNELKFIHGDKRIMVATTAFGMGVDVSNIRLVIHFNLPLSVTDYYQQIGRAGRDGEKSHAVLLYSEDDVELNRCIVKKDHSDKIEKRLKESIDEMYEIAVSDQCLVRQVLNALGDKYNGNCNRCTNCQRARRNLYED